MTLPTKTPPVVTRPLLKSRKSLAGSAATTTGSCTRRANRSPWCSLSIAGALFNFRAIGRLRHRLAQGASAHKPHAFNARRTQAKGRRYRSDRSLLAAAGLGKAQVTAVECQLMTFEEVFMPHMLLPDGRRMVEHAQKLLPPPAE